MKTPSRKTITACIQEARHCYRPLRKLPDGQWTFDQYIVGASKPWSRHRPGQRAYVKLCLASKRFHWACKAAGIPDHFIGRRPGSKPWEQEFRTAVQIYTNVENWAQRESRKKSDLVFNMESVAVPRNIREALRRRAVPNGKTVYSVEVDRDLLKRLNEIAEAKKVPLYDEVRTALLRHVRLENRKAMRKVAVVIRGIVKARRKPRVRLDAVVKARVQQKTKSKGPHGKQKP